MRQQVGVLAFAILLAAVMAALGQEEKRSASPYFECPYVNFFDQDCPQLPRPANEEEGRQSEGREDPAPAPGNSESSGTAERDRHGPRDLDTDELYPLFPRESLAPDTPPLLRLLLAEPTLENARRYVRWYARRSERLRAVQTLIELAGREGQ